MSSIKADQVLKASMRELCEGKDMLTGLTVCYGNRKDFVTTSLGLKREVIFVNGVFEDAPEEVTDTTIFDLASLTKVYTLVSVLQFLEQGLIRLDDNIRDLDARFVHLDDCTVEDCLTYLACLRTDERVDAQKDAKTGREVLFSVRRVPVLLGERLYSDMNALVLQYVVEAVSGLQFFEYLKQHVLSPVGLFETWADVPKDRYADLMDYNFEHKWVNGVWQVTTDVTPGLPHDPKARLLKDKAHSLSGHAGLFATAGDVCRFVQAMLNGVYFSHDTLMQIGVNRTGYLTHEGQYRQFLGLLCFCRSPIQYKSEVPAWMGLRSFGQAGYTGNHLAVDPETGVFDLLLGNRCHNRLSQVIPEEGAKGLGLHEDGSGTVRLPDGRALKSSFRFIHQKDRLIHAPVRDCLLNRGWL